MTSSLPFSPSFLLVPVSIATFCHVFIPITTEPHDSLVIIFYSNVWKRCSQDQRQIYLIIDALDECPHTYGIPSPREEVLQFVEDVVDLRLRNLHICVTSRPNVDIHHVLGPLASSISLHWERGQTEDIEDYIRSVVYSDSEPIMRRWRKDDKELVIKTLSERADGMYVDCVKLVIGVLTVK